MNILIPMAGEGSRFKIKGFDRPKPLIKIDDECLIEKAVSTLGIKGNYIFITRKYDNEDYNRELNQILNKIAPECIIHQIDYLTDGATATCLIAKEYINTSDPLIITNCDQTLDWDPEDFINQLNNTDGCVVTYDSTNPKNSFIKLDPKGNAISLAEKDPISNLALIGLHYWKHGSDFIKSAEQMVSNEIKSRNEYYIAPTYNNLIKEGKTITNYHIDKNQYISLGSPEDVTVYIGKQNEYNPKKLKTILCDIDGTILKHGHKFSTVATEEPELLPGVKEKFDAWDSLNYRIILMTGRKESARALTESHLRKVGLCWDLLIMNAGNGPRILINDKLHKRSPNRSLSVNVEVDKGFNNIDWENIGL
tara:strand:- start:18478 stop:19572 length:1095 start_codon:yes stop_codon:yes gene_type:complete